MFKFIIVFVAAFPSHLIAAGTPQSARIQTATPPIARTNGGLQRYNELALKILSRQFVGGKDDDSLQVQKELYKPTRGNLGAELEKQVTTDDSHTSTD